MPTFDATERFKNDLKKLSPSEKRLFLSARDKFLAALKANPLNPSFPKELRVKDVEGTQGIRELTWDWPDGRATWSYGKQILPGEPHIIWRRCGSHAIFKKPYGTEAS